MRQRRVEYAPEAEADLLSLYDRIANLAGPSIALGYAERLRTYISGFDLASERGTLRKDLRNGLRVVGFERKNCDCFQGRFRCGDHPAHLF